MFNRNHLTEMKWFEGVVENRQDPLKLGRVQVRIIGLHTDDLNDIPESDLLWSSVLLPVTSATMNGIGLTPALVEGTHVIGFFRDGDQSQDAIIMGAVPGIPIEARKTTKGFYDHRTDFSGTPKKPSYPSGNTFTNQTGEPFPRSNYLDEPDTNRLARNEDTGSDTFLTSKSNTRALHTNVSLATGGSYSEPSEGYAANYPYNKVFESESGHVVEFDDTPGAERVMVAHRSGSYYECLADGKQIIKTVNNQYNHVGADKNEHVLGSNNITIETNGTIYVKGNYSVKVDGNIDYSVGGNVTYNVTGVYQVNATSEIDLNGGVININ